MRNTTKIRYRYRIYPTEHQQHQLGQLFGCCRKVYNHFLADRKEGYEKYKETGDKSHLKSVKFFDMSLELTQLKKLPEFDYLNSVSSWSLQQSLNNLSDAFRNFFKGKDKKGYPKFKSWHDGRQSASFSNQLNRLKDGKLQTSKIDGPIKIKLDRLLPENFTDSTIARTSSGKYYVSFIVEIERKELQGQGTVGIDLGLTNLVTFSDGRVIVNPKRYQDFEVKIARLARQMSRKKMLKDEQGRNVRSKNREKARVRLAVAHERLANIKRDFLHKLTTELVRTYSAIGVESLRVANMLKNHKLAKHIAGANWGMFKKMLADKCQQYFGCVLVFADPFFPSSRLCSSCGHKYGQLTLSERAWNCLHCGAHHDRDVNAARNLEKLAQDWKSAHQAKEQGYALALDRQ